MPEGGQQQQQQQSQAPWYQGLEGVDQEMVGHWTAKGWLTEKPEKIAVQATKAWKEAERFVGAPADALVRLPKDAKDEAGWNAVWQRLGKPKEAKEYDFAGIKFTDGTPLEEGFVNTMREAAFSLNLPKDATTSMVQRFTKYLEDAETSEKTERDAKLLEQKATLKKNWGANEAANLFVAQRAAAALGMSPEVVAAFEGVIGYDKVMEMLRTIGTKIGEDKFIQSTNRSMSNAPMTRDEAIARKADLKSDQVWVNAYLAGDKAKAREMQALDVIITGIAAPA